MTQTAPCSTVKKKVIPLLQSPIRILPVIQTAIPIFRIAPTAAMEAVEAAAKMIVQMILIMKRTTHSN